MTGVGLWDFLSCDFCIAGWIMLRWLGLGGAAMGYYGFGGLILYRVGLYIEVVCNTSGCGG